MGGYITTAGMRALALLLVALFVASGAKAFVPLAPSVRATSVRNYQFNMMTSSTTAQPAKKRATIVGGGPAGALMAIFLAQDHEFEVDLFEAFGEERISGPTVRSWNVVLSKRGLEALKAAGVDVLQEASELAVQLIGSHRHHSKTKQNAFFNGSLSICRGDFATTLLKKANELDNVKVHFGCSFTALDPDNRVATFERLEGGNVDCGYDMLVGADGVNSRVRSALEDHVPEFTVRQREDSMAFKTILIPIMDMAEAEESWKSRFHVTNSKIGCILGPPRSDGMLTGTVVLPGEGDTSFEALMKSPQDVRDFFAKWYPSAFGPDGPSEEVAQDFFKRRPQHLKSTYCSSLTHGNVVLIGDAAHSMWASLGQGVNAALEDCQVLAAVVGLFEGEGKPEGQPTDIPTVLQAYNDRRLDNAHAVCELSEEGMGGGRSMRPAFMAQLFVVVFLNKTLGRLFPKVFTQPSIMGMNGSDTSYGDMLRGVKREAKVFKGLAVAGISVALSLGARVVLRV